MGRHVASADELQALDLLQTPVGIWDLERGRVWWANPAARQRRERPGSGDAAAVDDLADIAAAWDPDATGNGGAGAEPRSGAACRCTPITIEDGRRALLVEMPGAATLRGAGDAPEWEILDDILETASAWSWLTDATYRFRRVSPHVARVTGLEPAAYVGRTGEDFAGRGADPGPWSAFHRALSEHRAFHNLTLPFARTDGARLHVRFSGRPVFDAVGRYQGHAGIAADVTAEFLAREDVRHLQERLAEAIESMPDAFALFDADDRLVLFNRRLLDVFRKIAPDIRRGALMEELVRAGASQGEYKHVGPGDDAWVRERLAQIAAGATVEREFSDGTWRHVTARRTRDGGTIIVYVDITELKQREQRLRAITESATDAILTADGAGRILSWNPAAERIFGYAEREIRGRALTLIVPDALAKLPIARDGPEPGPAIAVGPTLELTAVRRDGRLFPIELSLGGWTQGADRSYSVIVRDVTARHRAEVERTKLAEQFFLAQRSEALGRLAGGIAHEFNNILGIILGYADLGLIDLAADHPLREHLGRIITAGRRARDLVRQILAYSRQEEVERRPVRLGELLDEMAGLLETALPKSVVLERGAAGAQALVVAAVTQIEQVLMNLCANAVHAVEEERGRVAIELDEVDVSGEVAQDLRIGDSGRYSVPMRITRTRGGRAHKLHVGMLQAGPHVRLTVSDNGSGMDRMVLERMFDPFFTTKEVGQGTGLGLAAVLGIVTSHNGALVVETERQVGTIVQVYLPTAKSAGEQPAAEASQPVAAPFPARIMVIDDEHNAAQVVAAQLTYLGYQASSRNDPVAAAAELLGDPYAWDLVITDRLMPRLSGIELVRQAHAARPDLPIILFTGFSAQGDEDDPDALGVAGLLYKPVVFTQLAEVVQRIVTAGAPVAAEGG